MRRFGTLLAAFAAMLPAGPLLIINGEFWPDTSCPAIADAWLRIEALGRLYHDLKNLMTELFRCDAQWWAKETLFLVWVLLNRAPRVQAHYPERTKP